MNRRTLLVLGMVAGAASAATVAQETAVRILPGVHVLAAPDETPAVTVTWYGVTTLLFDDGDTQILVDGFVSRPRFEDLDSLAEPDMSRINAMVGSGAFGRVAMITPVHSHFDHAMDVGAVAMATGATVVGSESTANIARGAGVDEARIVVVEERHRQQFGKFAVGLIRSAHAPLVNDGPPIPGTIDAPLTPPARIGDWKEGGSYTIVVEHPAGTALIQGSAGYVEGRLAGTPADVVYLGIGGLGSLGKDHAAAYFEEIVGPTGAQCVVPIHWDDFTLPFGEIAWRGSIYDVEWLHEFAAGQVPAPGLAMLPFGEAVDAFRGCGPS
ncbi:MAG: MBL fold metallo-hydrolase [Gammaproteobacteria bacterium]|nr:MBL fold metallo-hydrolase [Gammaproteobacteria bacterium]